MNKVCIIGFGKIGQAVAANILARNISVLAVDRDPVLLESFSSGSYQTNEPGLRQALLDAFKDGRLKLTHDYSVIRQADAVIMAIPLLINEQKEILHEAFADCLHSIAPWLDNNRVLVIETSIPVGYGRSRVVPAIESTGKLHGRDFLLAYSPERIKSGTMLEQLQLIPKVIGGLTPEATDAAFAVYEQLFDQGLLHKVENIEAAEMVKLAGMIYRDVNIALANQLAQFANAKQINFADLIPLINTDREANLLQPGIGVGGHCTPIYPYFLMDNFKEVGLDFTLARQGRLINNSMATHALSLVKDLVTNKEALILGLSFRPNVKEDTLSTTYLLQEALEKEGFKIAVHDTEYTESELKARGFTPASDIYGYHGELIFLVTMHQEYASLDYQRLYKSGVRYFVDGRNCLDRKSIEEAGIRYFGIGR